MGRRTIRLITTALAATILAVVAITLVDSAAKAGGGTSQPVVTSLTMRATDSYTPKAPPGATDDYHCTLLNPHLKKNVFIVSSLFKPNSPEVHHAVIFVVPPSLAAEANAANVDNKGWTCFGESALQGNGFTGEFAAAPQLTVWAPGHGEDVEPAGTGMPFLAGSLLVIQEHYNLLVGDHPVWSSFQVNMEPSTTPLRPLTLQQLPAPPDVPCPTGSTGPMCSRSAELASVGQRFGLLQEAFVSVLEKMCGRNPLDPPVGDSTSCAWPVTKPGLVVRTVAHMHLLGRSLKIVLNQGTPSQKTLLDVQNYNFHYQRAYNLAKPVPVVPGDSITVTCTYDPTLELETPILRRVPAHFVTWGDGSTDEMCLGTVITEPDKSVPESAALAQAFGH
jgi:hypothetical protein